MENDYKNRDVLVQCAMFDGIPTGILLIIRCLCEIFVVMYSSGVANVGYLLLTIILPFYTYLRVFRFNAFFLPQKFGFWKNVSYILFLFLFASMILAVFQYISYRFIFPDYLVVQQNSMVTMLNELKDVYPKLVGYRDIIEAGGVQTLANASIQSIFAYQIGALVMALPIAGVIVAVFKKIKI